MGKRSDFERVERDYYKTPYEAAKPLFPFLPTGKFNFAEPCAGDGRLVRHIREGTNKQAQCLMATDIEPDCNWVKEADALAITESDLNGVDMIITNPPWDRRKSSGFILHRMIEVFSDLRPTWLLFDCDWMQTVQARPYMERLVATVSIGRVKWIEDSTMTGKDNCQWALFREDARDICEAPYLFGRGAAPSDGFVSRINRPYVEAFSLAA